MKRVRFQQKYLQNQQLKEENPLFKDARKSHKKRNAFVGAGIALGCTLAVIAALYSPLTYIDSIEVHGLTTIPTSEMKDQAYSWMDGHVLGFRRRVPFFKKQALEDVLLETYDLEHVSVSREKLSLTVEGKERASEILLQESADQFHLIDLEGQKTVSMTREEFDSNPRIAQPTVPVFTFYDAIDFSQTNQYLTKINIPETLRLNEHLHASDWVPVQYSMQGSDAEWYEILVDDGFKIRVDGGLNGDSTFETISTAVRSIDPARIPLIDYIDVRFGNNVYFKER